MVLQPPVAGLVTTTMAVQPDGAVVVGGFVREDVSLGRRGAAVVLRLTPDGALDPTFGTGGVASVEAGPQVSALAIQGDGSVVLAGAGSYQGLFTRLNADGTLDLSFSGDGTASVTLGNTPAVTDLAVQQDGRIVAAAYQGYSTRTSGSAVRLLPDGTPDPSFGIPRPEGGSDGLFYGFLTGGGAFWSPSVYSAVELAPEGDILLAGVNDGDWRRTGQFVGRLPTATTTRPTFSLSSPKNYDPVTGDADVAALSDGRVVLSGNALPPQTGFPRPSRRLLLSILTPELDLLKVRRTRISARRDAYARAIATDSRDGVVMLSGVRARFEPLSLNPPRRCPVALVGSLSGPIEALGPRGGPDRGGRA